MKYCVLIRGLWNTGGSPLESQEAKLRGPKAIFKFPSPISLPDNIVFMKLKNQDLCEEKKVEMTPV